MTLTRAIIATIILCIIISSIVGLLLCLILDNFFNGFNIFYRYYDHIILWKPIIVFISLITLSLGISIPLEIIHNDKEYENAICEIKSLKDEVGVSGSFCLGNGHIDTEAYYFFYTQNDKGYKLKKVETSRTYIKVLEESKYETPTLTQNKNKGEWNDYNIIYIPQDYIMFEFNI